MGEVDTLVRNSALVLLSLSQVDSGVLSELFYGSQLYERLHAVACYDCKCLHHNTCGKGGRKDCLHIDPVTDWLDCHAGARSFDLYLSKNILEGALPKPKPDAPLREEGWW